MICKWWLPLHFWDNWVDIFHEYDKNMKYPVRQYKRCKLCNRVVERNT